MPLVEKHYHTTDDIYALPDMQRAELIDGVLYNMAPPTRIHQDLLLSLATRIKNYIQSNKGSCRVYVAPFGVFINDDDSNYVEPDISIICDPSKLTDKGCIGAPDLIMEIVSPSSRKMDYGRKNALYSDSGVREYWIIDPQRYCTTIYRYEEDEAPIIIPFEHDIAVGIYSDLNINIRDLLAE